MEIRSPYSVRPYQHVFDALSAYLWVAMLQREDKNYQGEYNVGPDTEQTMQTYELVEKMQDYLDFKWENTGKSIGKESNYLALDNTKIKSVDWVPAYSTNDLVVEAVSKWYNKSMQGEDMQKITLNQIKEAFNSYE